MPKDTVRAENPYGCEPKRHDGTVQLADPTATLWLQCEDANQDDHRQRKHIGSNRRHRRFDAFDRTQDRNRRRDCTVSVEQCRSKYPDDDHTGALTALGIEE
jgi:hypothetical protein